MGGSGGLGRVCSWWPAARPAGGAGSCRFPAGAALPGPPPHVPGPGWGLTGCQLSAGGRPDPPQGLRRGRPGGPIWAADGGSASEPAAGFSGAGGLPDRRGGSGRAAGDVPPGPGPRWRRAPRVAAGTTAGCCRLALLPGWRARPAVAAGTMPGMAPGGTLDGAGSGPGSDSLLVMTGSEGCQLVAGGPAACAPYPDSFYPAVQVTGSGGVPAVFRPGTGTGITVQGPGAALPVDLTAARAGASVTLNGGTCSSPGAVPWDGGTGQFSGVIMFTGSVAGSAGFVTGPAGGYGFRGAGAGHHLWICPPRPQRKSPIRTRSATSASSRSASRGDRAWSRSSPAGPRRENP
jgi:hypothetical protein